jgi:hypothetical protein
MELIIVITKKVTPMLVWVLVIVGVCMILQNYKEHVVIYAINHNVQVKILLSVIILLQVTFVIKLKHKLQQLQQE